MNIGIVTTWFERGAAYVSKQFKEILEKEHNVFIYARGGEEYAIGNPDWDIENVKWGKRKYIRMISDINLREFKKWLLKNKIDLVIFNEQRFWAPIILCKKLSIKTVGYIDYYTDTQIKYFELYDSLICNTLRHYSVFRWHSGAFYVPWGTNIELFNAKKYEIVDPKNITFFHNAGMSSYRKGTDLLIIAFNQMSTKDSKLIIHTQVELRNSFPNLVEIIESLVEENRLEIINKTVGAPGLYYLGDVYVYPSRLDGIGLTVIEALSSGLPVIVPDNAPMNEFVSINYNCGNVVKIDKCYCRSDSYYWPMAEVDIMDLTKKMEWFCNNQNKIPKMKRNARRYVERERDWKKNSDILNKIIKSTKLRTGTKDLTKEVTYKQILRHIFSIVNPDFIKRLKQKLYMK